MKTKTFPYSLAILAFCFVIQSDLFGGRVYLGIGSQDVSNASPSGVQTRYKIDNTNWDAMLGSGASVAPGYFVSRDSGNIGSLSGQTFHYQVMNLVGEGLYFTLNNPGTAGLDYAMSYGSFNPGSVPSANSSVNSATLLGVGGVATTPQTTPYNGLHLYSQATASGSSVAFSNVSFTLADSSIQVTGAFPTSGLANNGTPVVDSYLAYFNNDGTKGDLSSIGWTFDADVTITGAPGSNPKEGAKFEFTGKSMNYTQPGESLTAVPETSTWVMGFFALGVVALLARRKGQSSM